MIDLGDRRRCVFCGGFDLTGEHLWPDWLVNLLQESGEHDYSLHGTEETPTDFTSSPYSLRVNRACRTCNNGWMSDIDNGVKPFASGPILGNGRELRCQGQTLIAAWALKMALMMQLTHPRGLRFPAEVYRDLYESRDDPKPPAYLRVFTAGVATTWPGFYRQAALKFEQRGNVIVVEYSEDRVDGVLTTIGVNHLVLQVFLSLSGNSPRYHHDSDIASSMRRIWPDPTSFTWPPGPFLTEAELLQLAFTPK